VTWSEILFGSRNCNAGCWFNLYEEDVIQKGTQRPFARGKLDRTIEERRVVLRQNVSLNETPNVIVYPRSTTGRRDHLSHKGQIKECQPKCKLDRDGTVVFRVPCVVASDSLNQYTWSCEEPEDSDLRKHFNKEWKFGS